MRAGARDESWSTREVTPRAWCQLAPNPSAMTLDGTNTWIVGDPASSEVVVVDPGPLHPGDPSIPHGEEHLQAVLAHVRERGRRVALTLLTHGHADHAEAAPRFAELTGAPVRAVGTGHDDLTEGEVVRVAGVDLLVVATPGHTSDSVSFVLAQDNALLTGDTILGRGTTVVAWPDGQLAAYLESLETISRLTRAGDVVQLLPGHGPHVPDAASVVEYYIAHRRERLDQVRAALDAGDRTAQEVVERVYADVPRALWPAATLSVRAQLEYLRG